MKKLYLSIAALLTLSLAVSCGSSTTDQSSGAGSGTGTSSSGNTDTQPSAGLNGATTVAGVVKADNGDPMPGATVYIPQTAVTVTSKSFKSFSKALTGSDGSSCADPAYPACASTCSSADGSFNMDSSGCTTQSQLVLEKGSLRKLVDLSCSGTEACNLTSAEGQFGSGGTTTYPKVAVVTGSWDRIQDVLAKIAPSAYGTIDDSSYQLMPGSENTANLILIDGNNSLDSSYDDFMLYLNGTKSLADFDIVFINCGNSNEYKLSDNAVKDRLYDYVNNGGSLYVTDLSYDFVNQVFPSFMNYEGDVSSTVPGDIGDAEMGTSGITVNAAVNDTTMSSWLNAVTVNRHDADTPGNPESDCSYGDDYVTRTGALNANGTIPIGDFLGGWAHMVASWDAQSTIWISSGSGVVFDGLVNRPLTVSRKIGNGYVFYSSYHTAETCATPNFWPQERVLQYLIFEAF